MKSHLSGNPKRSTDSEKKAKVVADRLFDAAPRYIIYINKRHQFNIKTKAYHTT